MVPDMHSPLVYKSHFPAQNLPSPPNTIAQSGLSLRHASQINAQSGLVT